MEIILQKDLSFKVKGKAASLLLEENGLTIVRDNPFKVSGPGEYEVSDVLILGLKTPQGNVFRFTIDGVTCCYLGNVIEKLNQETLEKIDSVDILFIKSAGESSKTAVSIEPKVVIPMGEGIEKFLEAMGKKEIVAQDKLVTSVDKLPAELQVVWLK